MKAWNFKVKSNVQDIVKRLNSAFGLDDRFVFNMGHEQNDTVIFKVRKRALMYSLIRYNQIIVNGKILKTDTKSETDLEISFTQHFLIPLYVSVY